MSVVSKNASASSSASQAPSGPPVRPPEPLVKRKPLRNEPRGSLCNLSTPLRGNQRGRFRNAVTYDPPAVAPQQRGPRANCRHDTADGGTPIHPICLG
eukprot:9490592-Pyramimonas_sp.AAC.1